MERDKAIREVEDLKRIMQESRRRADRGPVWVGLALLGIGVLAVAVLPFLAPIVGIVMVVGGIIAYRRSDDSVAKGAAGAAIGIGVLLVAATLLAVLGLMAVTGGAEAMGPVDIPAQPIQPAP